MKNLLSVAAVLALAGASNAAVLVADLGTVAPPATLGGYTMQGFGADTRAGGGTGVSDVDAANGAPYDVLGFNETVNHHTVGDSWSTWSHGYTGDLYHVFENDGAAAPLFSVNMSIPAGASAFYFYAEPNTFDTFTITAVSANTVLSIVVDGSAGANGWGFYTDDASPLTSVTVSSGADFAVGEFGVNVVPTPGAMALAGVAGLVGLRRRR